MKVCGMGEPHLHVGNQRCVPHEEDFNTADQKVHVPNPQIREEIGERIQLIPKGRISNGVYEQIAAVPVPCAPGAEQAVDAAVLEIREPFAFDRPDENQSVQAEWFKGRCHVCLTAQTKEQPRAQTPDSAHHEHQEGNCAKQEQEPAARQIWYRFEGRSRPAEVRPGRGKEAEENAKKDVGITSKDQIYLVAGGKVVSWEEVTT